MTNIPELIKEAHNNAIERGFYDCVECQGIGHMMDGEDCPICKGTKIDPNRNIGELLMLIVSELGEALEAHRCGRFADHDEDDVVDTYTEWSTWFEEYWKDNFEDEIADVFIRLFDLCGYLKIDRLQKIYTSTDKFRNVGESLYNIVTSLPLDGGSGFGDAIFRTYSKLINLCEHMNIPIEKHIKAKMAYNRTRK